MYFLEDKKVGLRTLDKKDIEGSYADWLNDFNVCKYNNHHRYPISEDELQIFIEASRENKRMLVLAVDEKYTGKHVGNISLQNIDFINRQAEIAFLFGDKENQSKGYATNAARLLIKHAFNELGLNRIYFGTSEKNISMQRVGEKLGFTKVGILRQAMYKHGVYYDIFQFDLLKNELVEQESEKKMEKRYGDEVL